VPFSGGVNNPSVIIIQKFTAEELKRAEANIVDSSPMVFMSSPRTAGIDKRGKSVFLRHHDGREIVDEDGNKFLDDEITSIPDRFTAWWQETGPVRQVRESSI